MVMMFLSGLLTMLSVAYSVVDLPDPVGPVTRMAPYGLVKAFSYTLNEPSEKPSSSNRSSTELLSRIRMTTFSP